jgi:trehalose 6-phosphate phosphatase
MTKQTAFPAEDALAAAAASPVKPQPRRRFKSFPPPPTQGVGCRTAAGSWLDSVTMATSPRRAEHDDWMVRTCASPACSLSVLGSVRLPSLSGFAWRSRAVLPQEKHPSALAEFESVVEAASGKQIVMFLDYDGTLSPIVKDPDSAVMTEEASEKARRPSLRSLLRSVHVLVPTADEGETEHALLRT